MLVVDHTVLSEELFSKCFCCDLTTCLGQCCVEGDAGAPLEEEEVGLLENILPAILPYMTEEGRETVLQNGVFDYDEEGNLVTPLINDRECAFTRYENNCASCAIEKAFLSHKIDFRKPISCYLYPIRIETRNFYDVLEYHKWDICRSARKEGNRCGITLFQFLKDPLIQKYGEEWYRNVERELSLRKENGISTPA